MYDVCHPSYYKMSELGCKDELKITTAFYVYIELCEVRKLWDVEYYYEPKLDLLYLKAKQKKDRDAEFFIPWPARNDIKLRDVEDIQKHLNCKHFTLVVKSGESMSIFYEVTEGLKKPLAPQANRHTRVCYQKVSDLEKELRRNSRNLYELAKSSSRDKETQ